MNVIEKQKVVEALNSLEIIETNGGESAYALFENNEENRAVLNKVGISDDVINGYGDEETSCMLAIGFGEGYADLYDGNKLIVFEEQVEIELEEGLSAILFKHEGAPYISLSSDGGEVLIKKLTDEQVDKIKVITG